MDGTFQSRVHRADLAACAGPGDGSACLNGSIWSGRWLSRRLFRLLVDPFVTDDESVVIGLDDTIERRWGARIKARGIYRDPVRSSDGHFVKASGLRWSTVTCHGVPFSDRPVGAARQGQQKLVSGVHTAYRG
jgi:hypothetical protein